jgi:hypothetical protein
MSDDFPTDVKQFIGHHIESLAQLEALLLLRKDAEREWKTDEIAKILYITPEMSAALLADLARRGFAVPRETCYRYRTPEAGIDRTIEQLARVYQERRVAVITEIYSKPQNKVQTFADAFRLRKEE